MDDTLLTLTDISKTADYIYPLVVQVLPKYYEFLDSDDLPTDTEVLLEKPMCIKYAQVRIAAFCDEREKRKEKGHEFVENRNEYVGKELLIPLCYPGTLKISKKQGEFDKYTTIKQVIQDLPRYIRIDEETLYTPPGRNHPTSSLSTGARLEVKDVYQVDGMTHLQCKSVRTSKEYTFRDDIEIKCSRVNDIAEHTLLDLEQESILLPKVIQFQNVWPDDIVLKNDEEASTLLALTSGPMTILKTSVKTNVYIAWLRSEACSTAHRTIALIPENEWENEAVEVKLFDNPTKKEEYIQTKFGNNLETNVLKSALYTMATVEAGIVWIRIPKQVKSDDEPMNYENVDDEPMKYENVGCKMNEEVELPTSSNCFSGCKMNEEVELPTKSVKCNDSSTFKNLKEETSFGIGNVHDQLSKRVDAKHLNAEKSETELTATRSDSKTKQNQEQSGNYKGNNTCDDVIKEEGKGVEEEGFGFANLSLDLKRNENRSLSEFPTSSGENDTDDDMQHMYERVDGKEGTLLGSKDSKADAEINATQQPLNDSERDLPNQTTDLYSYTVEELEVCLKACGLGKFAQDCISNQLDGAFFRDFDLKELKSEPFNLSNIEVIKVEKIIECGWRPKK